MTPSRPYLVRAMYEWLVDNNATPYIVIDAMNTYSRVPQQHVKDGKIVLNVAPHAVKDLLIGNEGLSFSARFGGLPTNVSAPMVAILAIYARENGQGMFLITMMSLPSKNKQSQSLLIPKHLLKQKKPLNPNDLL